MIRTVKDTTSDIANTCWMFYAQLHIQNERREQRKYLNWSIWESPFILNVKVECELRHVNATLASREILEE